MKRLTYMMIGIVLCTGGCGSRSGEDRPAAAESTVDRTDSLFLGYTLGMSRQAFYDRSWELNRQGLVVQGPENQTVMYELENELPHPATMYYYPDFHEEKAFQMRVRFQYDGWAPWNRNLSADSLQLAVVDLLEEWYGPGFEERSTTGLGGAPSTHHVKVDGNRRIVVARISDRHVLAVFTDLVAQREIQRAAEAQGQDE